MSDTPPAGGYPVRVVEDSDWPGFLAVDSHAFGQTPPSAFVESERTLLEPGRSLAAFDGDTPVGIATAFSFDLTVPGGAALPAAGVSWVGVLPTHRRRGVLRSLMARQLHDVHDAGREPLAILWASEPQIYGRFGYGLATHAFSLEVPRDAHALAPHAPVDPSLRLRLVPIADWRPLRHVYDAQVAAAPGMLARDERWWERKVRDLPDLREGRSERRCVVVEDDQQIRGYAQYGTKATWSAGGPKGVVTVHEVMALDAAAKAALYRYLFDLDLMATAELGYISVSDPLLRWLRNPRAASPRWGDALYVRLVDLPAALGARSYAADVDAVVEVTDLLCPWNAGRWRLVAKDGSVTCQATDEAPDVSLDTRELGAAFLGGTDLVDLGLAGLVQERTPGALASLATAFAHSPAPWCPFVF